jgi:hypothetical protein
MERAALLPHGSRAWFAMVGASMCEAARQAHLPAGADVSLVEILVDRPPGADGLLPGLRFEIVAGQPAWRLGVRPGEGADIRIAVTAAASLALNTVVAADPAFGARLAGFLQQGALRIDGDMGRLGAWFEGVHDVIVARTAAPDAPA